MSFDRDPPRLRESSDSPPDLARALEMARAEMPDSAAMSEIESSLAPLSTRSGRSSPVSVRPVAAGAAASFKFLLAAVVAAASVGGAVHYLRSAPATTEPASPPAPPTERESTERTQRRRAEPVASASPAPEEASAAITDEAPKSAVRTSDRPNAVIVQKGPTPPSSVATSAAAFPEASGSAEVALLERATHLLGSDPAGALALTQEHAREYPAGVLTQEREFVAIEALKALGRTSEANARIDQFMARFPYSAHLRRLEQLRGATSDEAP